MLKVKKSWLYDTVEDGLLKTVRLGKQLRFRPSSIARYLDERASNGTKDRPGDRDNAPRDSRPRR